jgi:hypothetical protein
MLDELDDIAAQLATTTIKNLFSCIDAEAIVAAADWTRTNAFDLAAQIYAAPRNLVLDLHRASSGTPILKCSGPHA